MFCDKFGWNLHSYSGGRDFLKLLEFSLLHYHLPLEKWIDPSVEQNGRINRHIMYLSAKFELNWSSDSRDKNFKGW